MESMRSPDQAAGASGLKPVARIPWLVALVVLLFPACQLTDYSERQGDAPNPSDIRVPASGYDAVDPKDMPAITFDSTAYAMGLIPQGTVVEKTFRFTNTGGSDLLITDVRGSCGCTVGKEWPKKPLKPGEEGRITVTFNSEGRSGKQEKTVSVVANTTPPTSILTLTGEVVAPPIPIAN
jgi:hypothetical protein